MKQVVSGTYKPNSGDYDGMHAFESRKSDGFGGKMNSTVNAALKEFYNTQKKNPYISSIKVTMDDNKFVVNWEVTIEESPDGKAYVGLTSRGGAGPSAGTSGSIARAFTQIKQKKKDLPGEVSAKTETADIADYNFKAKVKGTTIRQIFVLYTNPDSFPNLPKSAGYPTATVGKTIGATPENLDNNSQVLLSSSIGVGAGESIAATGVESQTTTATTATTTTTKVGSVDGTSTNTGGSFDFVTLKESFVSVPPRRRGSVPVFIYYPKQEIFENETEKNESQFTFSLGSEKISGTQSGIKLASRIVGFDNKMFKLNGNSIDNQILSQTESPVKEWFKKYVNVFANNPYVDLNTLIKEIIEELETRSLLPSSLNLFMFGESTNPDTPVMQEMPNLTSNIKTLTLMETIPSESLVNIATKIKANGGRVYYTYNPNLFKLDLTDVTMISDSGTFSFKNDNFGASSVMFPNKELLGFTPSLVSNPSVVNSGLTTSFWNLNLPISVAKVGANYELNFGGQKQTTATISSELSQFAATGSYAGYSPRGLVYLDGNLIHKGPKISTETNLSSIRNFFSSLSYEDKDWIFTTSTTSTGTGSSVSAVTQELGVTFSFKHNGLASSLIPFSYIKMSDELIKTGAYVYDISKDAEYNRNRAGGTSSGWPDLIQQLPSIVAATGASTSGTPSTAPATASFSIRYLNLQSNSELNIEMTPQLALQIFSYDIESIVGKSADPNIAPVAVPKIRGQFIFDVRYKGILKNDALGEFKIIEKVEIDPFIPSTNDDLTGLSPEFLEEAFAGGEELQTEEEDLEIAEQLQNLFAQPEPAPQPAPTPTTQTTTAESTSAAEIPNSGSSTIAPKTPGFEGAIGNEFNGVPYFAQWDTRWSTKIFGAACSDKPTVKSSGCGPTSLTMAICYWAKKGYCDSAIPPDIAKLVDDAGGRVCGTGTTLGPAKLAKVLKEKYGLILKAITESQIRPILQKNYPCLISGKAYGSKGKAYSVSGKVTSNTTNGHFVCLTGIDSEGRIRVNDPGYAAKSGVAAFQANTNPSANMAAIRQMYTIYPEKLGSPV